MSNELSGQLAMMGLEALLAAALILGLFRLRTRFGLSLLLVTLGVFQPLQVILASSLYVPVWGGLSVSPGSVILFTASLFAVLLVYIREDALAARKVIYGVSAANLAMTLLMQLVAVQMRLPGLLNFLELPQAMFSQGVRVTVSGTLALFADVVLIILVYEWLRPWLLRWPFARIYATMVLVLTFDSLAFATGAFWGQPLFRPVLLAGIAGKSVMALVYAVALVVYLRFIEAETASSERAVRDIFYALTYRDKYERERQVAREALEASHARYRELFHLSPVPLWEEDVSALMAYLDELKRRGVQDLRAYLAEHPEALRQCAQKVTVLDVNQAALDLHHAGSKEELLGQLDKIFTPRSYETFLEEVVALAEGAQFFEKDASEVSTLDGETRYVSLHVRLRPDRQSVLLATPDVTRRVLAEEALRESEERLRAVIEQLSDGVLLTDETGTIIVWNRRLEEIVGLSAESMLGETAWEAQFELLPPKEQTPERRAQLEKSMRAFLETGQVPWANKLMQRSLIRPDGKPIFLEEIAFAIQTRRGFMLGSVIRDITERVLAERERDEARQLFQKVFELSPVALSLSRIADRKVVEINEAQARLLGYSRDELSGVHAPEIDYWADPAERQKVFEMLQAEGRVVNYPFTFRRRNGETGQAVIFAEIIEQQGEQYVLSVMVDITELQRYREHLEELVANRTAELEQRAEDLRRFALLAADRELRMKELREENEALRKQLRDMGSI